MTQSETTSAAGGLEPITILYTNWRGETAVRRIVPGHEDHARKPFWIGSTAWHQERQWLVTALDVDKGEDRDFALSGIKAWDQEAVDAALAAPTVKGGTDWHGMAERPRSRSKVVALYDDGSGAVMLYVHDEGAIDCEGFDFEWPDNRFDCWAYLPAGVEFHCETGEEAFTLPVEPPPAGAAGGGSRDLGALDGIDPHEEAENYEYRIDSEYTTTDFEKGMLEDFAAGLLEKVRVALEAPTPDLGAQGEPVAWIYEQQHPPSGAWSLEVSRKEPAPRKWFRNIEPVFKQAPAAPRPGSGVPVEEIEQALRKTLAIDFGRDVTMIIGFDRAAKRILALIAQAPRDGGGDR